MAKPKHIITVSDLHLGRGFEQDDFREPGDLLVWRDAAWEFFCKAIKKAVGDDATVVILNGDVFDLWEIAHDSELEGPGTATAIGARIFFPANTPQKEQGASDIGNWQVEEACKHHDGFVRGLKTLLAAPRISLRYHYGNHDHAMLNPALQQTFRDVLGSDAQGNDKLAFDFYYRSEDLRTYVEHGNQFAGGESSFENVEDWREETAGYYALRYIWNRFQHRYAISKPSIGEALDFMVAVLRRKAKSQQQVETFQYFIDYFMACDSGIVPARLRLKEFPFGLVYDVWKNAGKPATADDFFRNQVQSALEAPTATAVSLPGERVDIGLKDSRYTQGLMDRFFKAIAPFPRLKFTKDIHLTIGHTHQPGQQLVWGDGTRKQRYVNSGTWTRDLRNPTYTAISKGDEQMALIEVKRA